VISNTHLAHHDRHYRHRVAAHKAALSLCLRLDPLHVPVGETEMVADLVALNCIEPFIMNVVMIDLFYAKGATS
jgi:hypothetical protein